MESIDALSEKLSDYLDSGQIEQVNKAFEFASEAHSKVARLPPVANCLALFAAKTIKSYLVGTLSKQSSTVTLAIILLLQKNEWRILQDIFLFFH